MLDKYTENYYNQTSFYTGKKYSIENFRNYFGEDALLVNIRYMDIETYKNQLRQMITKHGTIRKDASVNRALSCLRHVFRKAVEWEMIEQSPFDKGKSLIIKENNQRLRFLTEDEIKRLINECPKYLRNIVECALNTGMRRGEILGLKWSQIRNGFIYLDKTKTNEARQIPINDDLNALFNKIREAQGLAKVYAFPCDGKPKKKEQNLSLKPVFTYKGKKISSVRSSFQNAKKNANIQDFKFHDLKHTFASQVLLRGGTLKDIQELLDHKTMTMTLRYAHLTQEHKRKAVNLLNGLTATKKTNVKTNDERALKIAN